MKVLLKNSGNFRIDNLFRKIIQLTTILLLGITLQVSAVETSETITLSRSNLSSVKFQKIIKGKVTDEKGLPISGANIVVKGLYIN